MIKDKRRKPKTNGKSLVKNALIVPFRFETISVQLRVGGQSQKYMKCSKDQYCYPGQAKYQL